MSNGEIVFWVCLAVFGTVDSALWSGLETGLYVVSRLDIRARLDDPKRSKPARRLAAEVENPERALATLLVMNNISNYLGALALAALLSATDLPGWAVTLINVAVLTPVLFVFAETLPKEVFRTRADQLMYPLSAVLRAFRIVLTVVGIVPTVLVLIKGLQRVLGASPLPANPRDRFAGLIQEAAGEGLLSAEQASLFNRAAAFRGITVADEMLPWSKVSRIRSDATARDWRRAVGDRPVSRLPVTDRRGEVIGFVRTADLAAADPTSTVRDLVRPLVRFEPRTTAENALRTLRGEHEPMGIVQLGGRPLGMVTVRDLVDPLTGSFAESESLVPGGR